MLDLGLVKQGFSFLIFNTSLLDIVYGERPHLCLVLHLLVHVNCTIPEPVSAPASFMKHSDMN